MHDTLSNKDCNSCLLDGGYNLTAMSEVNCDAFGVYEPDKASALSESLKSSTSSPSSTSSNSNNDDDNSSSISLLPSFTLIGVGLLTFVITLSK